MADDRFLALGDAAATCASATLVVKLCAGLDVPTALELVRRARDEARDSAAAGDAGHLGARLETALIAAALASAPSLESQDVRHDHRAAS